MHRRCVPGNRRTARTPTAAFEQKFPPGYFGHRAALGPRGRYGQWLLAQPVAIVINDTLFMHAGPSKVLQGLALPDREPALPCARSTNTCSPNGRWSRSACCRRAMPSARGPRWPQNDWRRGPLPRAARHRRTSRRPSSASPLRTARRCSVRSVPTGIAARRSATKRPRRTCSTPYSCSLGATRLVVGHTPTRDQRVATRFDGTGRQAGRRHEPCRVQGSGRGAAARRRQGRGALCGRTRVRCAGRGRPVRRAQRAR